MSYSMEQNITRVYDFIALFRNSFGYAPSVREIMNALEIRSTSSVHLYLKKLDEKGLINMQSKNISRAIELPNKNNNTYDTINVIPYFNNLSKNIDESPFMESEEKIMISKKFFPCLESYFSIRMAGIDMIDAGIFDKDYLIIKNQNQASDGDIVLVKIDGKYIVRRYFCENNSIVLKGENHFVGDILTDNAEIYGIVVGIIRNKM